VRVNEWVLRYRELLGDRLLDWAGPDESVIHPPKSYSSASMGGGEHDVISLDDDATRPIQPDARLDVLGVSGEVSLFVEYDRTRRVDKHDDKFRRYEAFLAGWWQAVLPEGSRRPAVVFVCEDAEHRTRFVDAADWQLRAYKQRWSELNPAPEFVVCDRVLFAVEADIRAGRPGALRLPHDPPRLRGRDDRLRGVWLPGRIPRMRSTPMLSELFRPCRSLLQVRPERHTRPDPPAPQIPRPPVPEQFGTGQEGGRGSRA
jgi:hypothetical protein